MAVIDNAAEAQKLFNKIIKAAKQKTKYVFDECLYPWAECGPNFFTIGVTSDICEWIEDEARSIISKHPRATWVETSHYKGSFDWMSDTYIKPSVAITFKF